MASFSFKTIKSEAKKIILSVKGGENIIVSMVRDLKGIIEREKAAIGLFITLNAPTKPMQIEAASAWRTGTQGMT